MTSNRSTNARSGSLARSCCPSARGASSKSLRSRSDPLANNHSPCWPSKCAGQARLSNRGVHGRQDAV
eukprot:3444598-Pyramimonas_sp.AAC.1